MRLILKYLRPYVGFALLCVLLLLVQGACELAVPYVMSGLIDSGVLGAWENAAAQQAFILERGAGMVALTLLLAAAAVVSGLFAAKLSARFERDMRRDVYTHVLALGADETDRLSPASLITRTTSDVTRIKDVVAMALTTLCYAPILGIGGAVMAARTGSGMGKIIFIGIAVIAAPVALGAALTLPKFKKLQTLLDRLSRICREQLTGIRVIRAFRTEKYEEKRFGEANADYYKINLFLSRLMACMPVLGLLLNLISVVIIWAAAPQIAGGVMGVGAVMAYVQYVMVIIMAFMMLGGTAAMLPRAAVSIGRIREVLDTPPAVKDADKTAELPAGASLEFRDVCYRYPGSVRDAVSHVSFSAAEGETVAIVGATGSGKTTLAALLPRLRDVTGGAILFGGTDIRELPLSELRRAVGYVPQKSVLFSGSVASNLRSGRPDASDAELWDALETARADGFVREMNGELGARIAQGGVNVSGGQRQRLAIARAVAERPQVYVFDDSFSALDMRTDADVRARLAEKTASAIKIIVAQRLGTVIGADRIVLLHDGEMTACGTHAELLESSEEYRAIAESQGLVRRAV